VSPNEGWKLWEGHLLHIPGVKDPGRFSPALVLSHIHLVALLVSAVDAGVVKVADVKEVRS